MTLFSRGASSSFPALSSLWCASFALLAPAANAQLGSPTCSAAVNSTGVPATIVGLGSAGADDDAFALRSASLPPNSVGYFLAARAFGSSPNPVGAGDFCLGGSIGRFSNSVLGSGSNGEVTLDVELTAVPLGASVLDVSPGDTLHFQFWYRDQAPGGAATTNLSPGLEVTFHAGERLFAGQVFGAGGSPDDVVLADFDGDGALDIATANSAAWDPGVSVLRGDGRGGFGARSRIALPSATSDVAAGDVNGDGRVDLAVGQAGGDVAVALGRGDGSFDPPQFVSMGLSTRSVALRDLDGDGLDDIVSVDPTGGTLAWRLAGGQGALQSIAVPVGPQVLLLGDVDADGLVDALVSSPQVGTSSLAFGVSGGGFAAPAQPSLPAFVSGMAFGDLDGDGTLDLAVGGSTSVVIYANDGTGSFTPQPGFYPVNSPRSVAIVDVDGDGLRDVVAFAVGQARAHVFRSAGPGPLVPDGVAPLTFSISAGAVGDLDGDGSVDLVASSNPSHRVAVALNDGSGAFPQRIDITPGFGIADAVAADFDGDGVLDLALASRNTNDVGVLLSPTTGSLVGQVSLALPIEPDVLAVGDVAGSSAVDLVALSQSSGSIALVENRGPFGFVLAGALTTGVAATDLAVVERPGTSPAIVTSTDTGAIQIWTTGGVLLGTTQAGFPVTRLLAVDLDGDGARNELVAAGLAAGAVRVATFTSPGLTPTSVTTVPGELTSVASGDFNVDGVLDLVVLSASTRTATLLRGDGAGGLTLEGSVSTANLAVDVALADVDGDGRDDLVIAHTAAGVRVHRNSPWAPFAEFEGHAFVSTVDGVLVGDFGGDGRADITATTPAGASFLPGQ